MNLEQIVKETVAKIVAEKTLTAAEEKKREEIVKAMKKDFKGPAPAMYAIATDKAKKLAEEDDHEVSMAQRSLDSIIRSAMELKAKIGDQEINIPAWIQDHITNSENYIDQASQGYHEYHNGGEHGEIDEANLGHNETSSIEQEGRFWIVTYNTADGTKEKSFESEDEARKFYNGLDEAFQPKSSFDDYSIGDNVTVAGKKAKITAMKMDDETGERRARVRFEDDSVKDVNINSLDEAQESNNDKIAKYEKYTYTLDGETVKPEITFLNNILKAMIGNKIYNVGAPENGKVELTPESGKKGMYNEAEDISDDELSQLQVTADDTSKMPAERDAARNKIYASRAKKEVNEVNSAPMYYAVFDFHGKQPFYMTSRSAMEMLSRLNGYLKAIGNNFLYKMSDLEDSYYKDQILPSVVNDDFAMVTKNPEFFKKHLTYYPNAVEYKGLDSIKQAQELDEFVVRRWQHYAGIK
jgi:hypothetical protein